MVKVPETKHKYFSVKHTTKIGNQRYVPSVCYPIPSSLQDAVEKMAGEGLARIFNEEVRFVTGVAYQVNPPSPVAAPQSSSALPQTDTERPIVGPDRVIKKKNSRSAKSGFTQQSTREFD